MPEGGSGESAGGLEGDASKGEETDAAKVPRIKVPRPELLGSVVARLAVRRDLPDEEFAEIEGDFLSSEDDGSCDDMSDSDGEEGAGDPEDRGISGAKAGRRRRRGSKRKGGEATVVREAIVSSFDETEGLYVLVNTHEEEEKLSLAELEVALHQSQVRAPAPSIPS